jgi:NADPH:quinone reductase-like Zn-dependent oxidoreductase
LLRADPFLVRLGGGGFFKPRNKILGADVAGTVAAVGGNVKGLFNPGDEVYGDLSDSGKGEGCFAEFVCADEKRLALKPACVSFGEAAAIPMAAVTALQGLRDVGRVRRGQSVLINGASGGVGTFAVQLAKAFGAEITAVCGSGALDTVRALGADYAVDYTRENVAKSGKRYDLILDVAANYSVADYRRVLKPGGIAAVIGFSSVKQTLGVVLSGKKDGKRISLVASTPNGGDLIFLNKLLESGEVRPVIDKRYPLGDLAEAIRYLETGHPKGKVIITVRE